MKKRFVFTSISFALALIFAVSGLLICKLKTDTVVANIATRNVELQTENIDYESILNEFEDATFETNDELTTFVGYKKIDIKALAEFDNLSETDIEQVEEAYVKYDFSYNEETNIVTISAEMKNELGEIEVEEISGVAFINEKNQIDAVMNIDGESILLSEMQESGMIQNCGWFKKLIKKVVKVAVVAVTVATVAVATAAVVVATAGAAAPALVAAGVGITTSAGIGVTAGVAAGALFALTVGQAAIQAETAISEPIAEGVSQVVDKATNGIMALIISGVEYVTMAVTLESIKDIKGGEYRFISIKGGLAFISKESVKREIAVWGLRLGANTYCVSSVDARQVAYDAGNGIEPRYHSRHELNSLGQIKKGVYFDHYHTYANSVAYDALGFEISSGHAFFGEPSINL